MISFINQLRIPTLLGLSILILGIAAGVYSIVRDQHFITKASPSLIPQNLTLTNIDDRQVTISWQTSVETPSFIAYGQALNEQTVLDDRDADVPRPHTIHHITLKNLLPKTTYQYKIISGRYTSDPLKFTTASPASEQNGFSPAIGSVLEGDKPLSDGVVYLTVSKAITQSTVIKNLGNFVIPLSFIRKSDLSDTYPLVEGTIAKITVISDKGASSALFKLYLSAKPLPPLRLGQNLDLTNLDLESKISTQSGKDLAKYDLNGDGLVNAADYAIVLKNLGSLTTGVEAKKADLNDDKAVNQKDLELISKKLTYE